MKTPAPVTAVATIARFLAVLAALALLPGCVTSSAPSVEPPPRGFDHPPAGGWGRFSGPVRAEFLPGSQMKLLEDVVFTEPSGREWVAPKGAVIDGASIPKPFWSVIGGPFDDRYRMASIYHDVACDSRTQRWEDVHLMFYRAMRCSGVPEKKAKQMFTAVWYFGPHWKEQSRIAAVLNVKPAQEAKTTPTTADALAIKAWVARENPDIRELADPVQASAKLPTQSAVQKRMPAPPHGR
jgi:Protein of unknown function (DUF1353)